jgi:UDP-glucose 4-epimerase
MSSRSLVTGGAGFIGSHLAHSLLQQGSSVRVLDNFSTGRRENLADISEDVQVMNDDLRNLDACISACRGMDTVYHMGALGSVPRSIDDPLTTNAVNVQGTLNVLIAARECGVGRVIFSSSSSVYGDTPTLPKREGMLPNPRSPYAVSKLAGEEYCRAFALSYGLETIILRYFNVFGPQQDPSSQYAAVIPKFLAALHEGRRPVIYGDGTQSRDFTYVSNVVNANLLASQVKGVSGEVFNIACGEQVSVKEMLARMTSFLGRGAEPEYKEPRVGDVLHSRAAIDAAEKRLGYHPAVLFDEGLSRTIQAFVEAFSLKARSTRNSQSRLK